MVTASDNYLLHRLSDERDSGFLTSLNSVPVKMGEVLFDAGETIRYAYFPTRGTMISMIRSLKGGDTAEVGIVGWDGVAGISSVMRATVHQFRGLVQSAGTVFRARSEDVVAEFDRRGALYDLFLRYVHAVLDQLAQTAVCNRLHHVEERLARWLLIVHDYAAADDIPMTHEFISMMLGIRRAGVTTAIGALTIDGVIEHGRNKITIRDRRALEAVSCECYAAVRDELDRSLGIRR